jgi:glycosyltransferase involved in cell wall biosynthesis
MERRPTRFRVPGREGWCPGWIVVHTTDGTYATTCAWFDDPRSGVSAHYLVGLDGRVAQFVEEEDAALHAGGGPAEVAASRFPTPDPNLHTIGIEFEDGGAPLEVARTPAQYRAGAALLADVAARWDIPLGREHVLAHRELNPGKDCPGNLDLERLIAAARDSSGPGRPDAPLLAVLLPARNAAADLPGWLESVGAFADTVVALDDGSTDDTAELLEASPLVETLLRNPVREGYAGWDDAANRQRLLDAAAELSPAWVLFLDADERIDAEDGRALREFLEEGPDPGNAYGFRVFRMAGDEDHYDQAGLWVYRLFSPRPGSTLPPARLHLVPVPADIPRERWRDTTFRIRHLAGLDQDRRRRRFAKYEDADPDRLYQRDYSNLLEQGLERRPWIARPPGLPALADPLGRGARIDLHDLDLEAPVLSAIVISRDDEDRIERCVASVAGQRCDDPFEVIVVVSGSDRTAEIVRERFPGVKLVTLPRPALPGEARNAGLAVARGDYVSFPGSHIELPPGSLAARIRAHSLGYGMVTGTVVNGTESRAGWASYFLDHSNVLPGRPSGELKGPPSHCSYVRDFVLEAGGFPEDMRTGEDTVVNNALWRRGLRAYRAADVHLVHKSPCVDARTLVRHHFRRGRGLGRMLCDRARNGRPLLRPAVLRSLLVGYVPARLRRTRRAVSRWGPDLMPEYRRSRRLVAIGTVAAWAGTWFEILRPGPGKLRILFRGGREDG